MKVFVLVGIGDGENEERVLGVYDNSEKANSDMNKLIDVNYGWEDYEVREFGMNEPNFELDDVE